MRSCVPVALAAVLAITACSQSSLVLPVTGATKTASADPRRCNFVPLGHTFRPGEDFQFIFTVKANSQWCFGGFSISGLSTTGQAIQQEPSHGRLRLEPRPGLIIVGYRPEAGYIGSDRFRISVPSQINTSYFAGNVTVAP